MKAMRRLVLAAFAGALSMSASAGCGSGPTSPTPVPSSHVGRYNLVTAKGQPLPATVYESSGSRQEVIGGYVELRQGNECAWSTEYRYTDGGRVSTSSSGGSGTYTLSGSTIVMTYDRTQIAATWSGDTLTIRADVELVYRK